MNEWTEAETRLNERASRAYATATELQEQIYDAAERGDFAAANNLQSRQNECVGFAMQLQREASDMFLRRTGRDVLLPDEGNYDHAARVAAFSATGR